MSYFERTVTEDIPDTAPAKLRASLKMAHYRLLRVRGYEAGLRVRPGGWTRKQILGHLLDSAINNHYRLARAVLEDGYRGPGYDQDGWNRIHAYGDLEWHTLVNLWEAHNRLLEHLVEQIPPSSYQFTCQLEGMPPTTIQGLIADYVTHLEHHVDQICAPATRAAR
jgi:hypothetical protein